MRSKRPARKAAQAPQLHVSCIENMLMNRICPDISLACQHADNCLWEAYERSALDRFIGPREGRLVFPKYRDKLGGSLRVSEQEARFAFVESLNRGSLLYSVEAPTDKLYQFTGKTKMSAQTDLALHNENGQRICNVEFKAKGFSPSACRHFSISKDLQKLLREPIWGLWFHLLESVNNSTINKLLNVIAVQIWNVQQKYKDDIDSPGLTIHICVLRHRFSLQRDLSITYNAGIVMEEIQRLLSLDLSVSRSKLLGVENQNGWKLHRYEGTPANPTNTVDA